MSIGTADQAVFGYWKQTAWGTDPVGTTPEVLMRVTGDSLGTTLTTIESAELTGKRDLQGLYKTDGESGGAINFQLSYSDFDELWAAAFGGPVAWTTNVLKNSNIVQGFAFQKKIADIATPVWIKYPNAVIDTMSMTMAPGQLVTGSFGLKAGVATANTTSMSSGTATAPSANPVYSSVVDITGLEEGGSPITQVSNLTLNSANNYRLIKSVGVFGPSAIAMGVFRLTGTLEAYFQDKSLLDKFLNSTATSLSVHIGTGSNKTYEISIPKVQYTSAEVVAGGIGQDVMAKMNWTAYYDDTLTATVSVTRTP